MKLNLVPNRRGNLKKDGYLIDDGELQVFSDMLHFYLQARMWEGHDVNNGPDEYDEFAMMEYDEIGAMLDNRDIAQIQSRLPTKVELSKLIMSIEARRAEDEDAIAEAEAIIARYQSQQEEK
jgi:hypothetical protein